MAANLVQLLIKPGIQRDRTKFQGDMCTDGYWVRFDGDVVVKMGGLKAVNEAYAAINRASNLLLTQNGTPNSLYLYRSDNTGVYRATIGTDFTIGTASVRISPAIADGGANILWQSVVVIRNGVKTILFLKTLNAAGIAQSNASVLYRQGLVSAPAAQLEAVVVLPAEATGGMCYSKPYLFIYGNNGYARHSSTADPTNFTGAGSGDLALPVTDKVIYAANIRSSTSPSLLFWTLTCVVRSVNVGDAAVAFKNEVVTSSSSILSSRCVVEYDGMFFWPGTERFFNYNGVVSEMDNKTNQNYFYNNIDMSKRQLVFGLKNQKHGEIWWFYPEKINSADPTIGCTRAIIYNKRENCWYDTAIRRDCGYSFDDLGIMVTAGKPLDNAGAFNYVWRHEFTNDTENYVPGAGGAAVSNNIFSYFTTPTFSYASPFAPGHPIGAKSQAIERNVELLCIEPDFNQTNATMSLRINTRKYAQSPTVISDPINFAHNTEKIDLRTQGRQMSLTFGSNQHFEMGTLMLTVGIGDGRA